MNPSNKGKNIFDLLEIIEKKIDSNSIFSSKLISESMAILGNGWKKASEARFDYKSAIDSIQVYFSGFDPKDFFPIANRYIKSTVSIRSHAFNPTQPKTIRPKGKLLRSI